MPAVRWVQSLGGPLLLLPVTLLREWGGVEAPPPGREIVARFRWHLDGPATDYDRACDVTDYAGVIPVGAGEGLVLGEEPTPATWLPREDGGLLARWVSGEREAQVVAALARVPATLAWQAVGTLRIDSSPLELFDAAEPGHTELGEERLRFELAPGPYAVSHAAYAPDADTALHLVRLHRSAGPTRGTVTAAEPR